MSSVSILVTILPDREVLSAIKVRNDSSLLRHELGYILGQLQNPIACGTLIDILSDETEDVLVRHEVWYTIFMASYIFNLIDF